jgi:hypothetical protein
MHNTYKRLHDIRDHFYVKNVPQKQSMFVERYTNNLNNNLNNNQPPPIQKVSFIEDLHRVEHFKETKVTKEPNENKNDLSFKTDNKILEMKIESAEGILSSPDIFGPPFWFTLHASSMSYPLNPTPIVKDKMRNFIIAIPVLLPCKNCQEHATAYIEKHYNEIDTFCSGRDSLFKFFVDFHNEVNKRKDKKIMSYEDAYQLYSGKVKINKISYS